VEILVAGPAVGAFDCDLLNWGGHDLNVMDCLRPLGVVDREVVDAACGRSADDSVVSVMVVAV
jgi:hypothetical protein